MTRSSAVLSADWLRRQTSRISSIDFVRGVVMILMAIDHVRVYSGLPAGGPTLGIFLTRWITNFAAPAFVFLAGTAAYLQGRKLGDRSALSRFLATRGAFLVLLELTVLRVAWTFNFDFSHYLLAGVIWMIGLCMIVMAALVRLPIAVNVIGGVAIVVLHNITDFFSRQLDDAFGSNGPNWILKILYFGGTVDVGGSGPPLFILYVIVPWIGVMMTGYAFGTVMEMPPDRRPAICLKLGITLTALFIVVRAVSLYGDPRPWKETAPAVQSSGTPAQPTTGRPAPPRMPAPLRFLNTTKYPASLSFLLMTLGPMFILLGYAERWHGKLAEILTIFGRVPMFYYLLHIPLIHLAACIVSKVREGHVDSWLFANHPVAAGPAPAGYTWSLGLLYAVYAVCLILLYFPCRWFAMLRAKQKSKWLGYL